MGGIWSRAASFRMRMFPTMGPFPWLSTTSTPSRTSSAIGCMVRRVMAHCSSNVPVPRAGRMAFPPSVIRTRFEATGIG
jgi:hypothetical protein